MLKFYTNLKIRTKILTIFILIISIFAIESCIIYYNTLLLEEVTKSAKQNSLIRRNLNEALRAMINAETGFRGYLITGDRASLEPYHEGKGSFSTALSKTINLTIHDAAEQKRLSDIKVIADQWFNTIAEPAIALRAQPDTIDAALDFERSFKGKTLMDHLRKTLGAARDERVKLTAALMKANEDALNAVGRAMSIGSVMMLLSCFAALWYWPAKLEHPSI